MNDLLSKGMAKTFPSLYQFLRKQDPVFWEEMQSRKVQRPEISPETPAEPERVVPTGPQGLQKLMEEIGELGD